MSREDILIVCALEQETNNELEGWNVIYTGCGKVNATYELTAELFFSKDMTGKLKNLPKLVINFGTAGSKNIPIHTLVDCNRFVQRDMDASGFVFIKGETPFDKYIPSTVIDYSYVKNPIGKNYVCGTGDSFVEDISNEIKMIDVFDMESYALAKTCWKTDIDFVSFKYITDNVNEKSADDWEKNCGKGVKEFKKVLEYYENL